MSKRIGILAMITILSAGLLGTLPFLMAYPFGSEKTISGEFTYLGNDDVTVREHHYTYSDGYFRNKSSESSFDLLKCSMNVALAASRAEYIKGFMDKLGFDYTDKIDEEKEGINVLAGSHVEDSIYYPAQIIGGVDYYNSIAYGIGKKEIGDTTLILVAVRGSDYGIEWGGDFDIGTGENHEGFQIASEQVLEGLKAFIKREKITGKIKVWTAGYSRGAATVNLFAAALDDGAVDGIAKDDVYAFCFECPRTTRNKEALESKYDNIFCVANPDDIVPKVAMGVWGYRRFGKSFHFPAYQSDANYESVLKKKDEAEKAILGEVLRTAQDVAYPLNTFIEDLAVVAVSPEEYVKNYQSSLIRIAMGTFGKPNSVPTREDYEVLRKLELGLALINRENTEEIARLLGSDGREFRIVPGNELLNVHNMENSLAWLDSFEDFSNFGENSYGILNFIGATDIKVEDDEGNTLASVSAGRVEPVENGLFTRTKENGGTVLVFPVNGEYKLTVSRGEEPLYITFSNFEMALGYPSKTQNYEIEAGTTLNGEIKNGEVHFTSDGEIKTLSSYSGEDVKLVTIVGRTEGGYVSGGGIFTSGQRISLRAVALDGAPFVGWYRDGKLVSNENPYSFTSSDSENLIAVFKRN